MRLQEISLLLAFGVFVAIVVRILMMSRREIDHNARIPLADDNAYDPGSAKDRPESHKGKQP